MSVTPEQVREARTYSDHGEFAAMMSRMVRAYSRRMAEADPYDLVLLLSVQQELDEAIRQAVAGQRAAGFSWAEIARPLGISKQAAQQRWGR